MAQATERGTCQMPNTGTQSIRVHELAVLSGTLRPSYLQVSRRTRTRHGFCQLDMNTRGIGV